MSWIDKLIQASTLGRAADYTQERSDFEEGKSPEPTLGAEDLRRLILGLRSQDDPVDFQPALSFHWEIRGLRITGRLELRDGRLPSGGPLPALEFIGCTFEAGIDADGAHMERFHLSRCKLGTLDETIPQLSLQNVRIENELRITRLEPVLGGGLLRIDASSANVGGNLIIERLELRALGHQRMDDPLTTPFALNLRNANVRADIRLQPELTVHGGIMAVGIHVGGDLRAVGMIADDGEDGPFRLEVRSTNGEPRNALALDSSRIAANVFLGTKDDERQSRITGRVSMQGIHIEGALSFFGFSLFSGCDLSTPLHLLGAIIKGGCYAQEASTKQGTKIRTSLSDGVVLYRAYIARGLTLEGEFTQLYGAGLRVDGDVLLTSESGVRKEPGASLSKEAPSTPLSFDFTGANVAGSLSITTLQGNTSGSVVVNRCSTTGDLDLDGSFATLYGRGLSVHGKMTLSSTLGVRNESEASSLEEGTNAYAFVDLTGASVTGSLHVSSRYINVRWKPDPNKPEGTLTMGSMSVGGELTVTGVFDRIFAKHLIVMGNAVLKANVFHYVELSKADLRGDLDLSRFSFDRDPLNRRGWGIPVFNLADADIRRALKLGSPVSQDNEIVFSKARISSPLCYPQLQVIEVGAKRTSTSAAITSENPEKEAATETVFWTAFLLFPGRAAVNLDGTSDPIHSINSMRGFLRLHDPEQQRDYLRFFCAYVWGVLGPFQILDSDVGLSPLTDGQTLPKIETIRLTKDQKTKVVFHAKATHVLYGGFLFRADFEIYREALGSVIKGMVIMSDDEPAGEFENKSRRTYHPPLAYSSETEPDDSPYAGEWKDISDETVINRKVPDWRVPFRQKTVDFKNAIVDLRDASCGTLEDADGVAWGSSVTLRLENFTYARITATSESTDEMIAWPWKRGSFWAGQLLISSRRSMSRLRPAIQKVRQWMGFPQLPLPDFQHEFDQPSWFSNLQESDLRRTGVQERLEWLERRSLVRRTPGGGKRFEPFLQQPYVQLAKVFREQGDESEARKVEAQRIRIDRWLRAKQSFGGKLALPVFGLYRLFFLYGLSPLRAICTFTFFLALGWAATAFVNKPDGLLVQNTSTVATAISMNGDPVTPIVPYQQTRGRATFDCGDAISEPLYAIDVFIPLLDLRQEGRCDIAQFPRLRTSHQQQPFV